MTLSIGPTGSFVFFLGRGRGNVQVENIRAPASTSPFAEEKPFQGALVGRFSVCPSDGPSGRLRLDGSLPMDRLSMAGTYDVGLLYGGLGTG